MKNSQAMILCTAMLAATDHYRLAGIGFIWFLLIAWNEWERKEE